METEQTPFEALQAAVEKVGSQSAFARMLGVSQPTVWKWLQSAKRLPAEYVLQVERETQVSRHHLRPDIYPPDLPPFSPDLAGDEQQLPCNRDAVSQRKDKA